MKKLFFSPFLFFALALTAQVNDVKTFTLQEAVQYALQNNVNARNAALGVAQAKARNHEVISLGLPQISAEMGYNYYFKQPISPAFNQFFGDTTSSTSRVFSYLASNDANIRNILIQSANQSKDQEFSFVLKHNFSSSLTVSQLLLDGRYFIGVKATKDLLKTAQLQSQMSALDIKYAVAKAYHQAAAAKAGQGLLEENLKLVEKLLADTRAVYAEGFIEELDVNRLELVETQLKSQINLQNQLTQVALDNLKFQMGLNLKDEIVLKDNLEDLKGSVAFNMENNFDVTKRPEYEMLQTALRLQGYDAAQRRSGYFPSLFAFLNYGWQAQANKFGDFFKSTTTTYPDGDTRTFNQWFDQGLVGVSLKIPIFDSGQKMAQVKQAKLEQQKTRNNFDNFRNAAELQFRASQSQFNAAMAEETNSRKSVALSEKIFLKNQIKYKEGVGSSFELVQSETEFTANQLKYIQSTLNLLNAKADLDKALGVQ